MSCGSSIDWFLLNETCRVASWSVYKRTECFLNLTGSGLSYTRFCPTSLVYPSGSTISGQTCTWRISAVVWLNWGVVSCSSLIESTSPSDSAVIQPPLCILCHHINHVVIFEMIDPRANFFSYCNNYRQQFTRQDSHPRLFNENFIKNLGIAKRLDSSNLTLKYIPSQLPLVACILPPWIIRWSI